MAQQAPTERPYPKPRLINWSEDQERRILRASKVRSKSFTEFVRDAAMLLVNQVEEEQIERRRLLEEEESRAFVPKNARAPRGLALKKSPASVAEDTSAATSPAATAAAPTIIVNTGQGASPSRDEVDLLAEYVLAARNSVDSEERKRLVGKVLSGRTKEEQVRLTKLLDDKVRAGAPKKPAGWGLLGGLGR